MSLERIEAIVDELGETVTLRRVGSPNVDVTVKASIRQYVGDTLPENALQGTAILHMTNSEIAAAAWPGPPRANDKVIRDSKVLNVESAETRNYREDAALHILRIKG